MGKRLAFISACVFIVGIVAGGTGGWLIAKKYYEDKQLAVVESLEDEFWNNGKSTGENKSENYTFAHIQQATPTENKTEKTHTTVQKSTTQRQTVPYGGHSFILNTSSKKIHTPDCDAVKTIAPENYSETDDFVGALAGGYTQCKQCYPLDH